MRSHHRAIALALAACSAAVAAAWFGLHFRGRPTVVLGPMVQNVRPDGFTIVWYMHPAAPSELRVKAEGKQEATYCPASVAPRPAAGITVQRCQAEVGGLEPGRRYDYEILEVVNDSDRRVMFRGRARAAPPPEETVRVLAFGDSGTGGRHQRRLARLMETYDPDVVVHTGDLIYPRGRPEDFPARLFIPYAELLAGVPFYPCLGNHEYKLDPTETALSTFALPKNGPPDEPPGRHYWFDFGPARFVAIDSNHDGPLFAGRVAPWLDGVLAGAGDRWKIVFFHEPIHTHGKYPPADKLQWSILPVMERHGVAMILCGHNHMYERSHPLLAGRRGPAGEGITHVTTGAGGANLASARLPMPETMAAWDDRQHSFTIIDLTPEALAVRQVGISGRVLDWFELARPPERRDAGPPGGSPATAPAQASG